jgi:hypothetical protein
MKSKLAKTRAKPKSGNCRIRNQKTAAEVVFPPVMQKVQDALPSGNAVAELVFLTGQPLSNCQKMLSENRLPNPAMLAALCQTRLVIETVLALTEGGTDPAVRDVHKAVLRLQLERKLAALDGRAA